MSLASGSPLRAQRCVRFPGLQCHPSDSWECSQVSDTGSLPFMEPSSITTPTSPVVIPSQVVIALGNYWFASSVLHRVFLWFLRLRVLCVLCSAWQMPGDWLASVPTAHIVTSWQNHFLPGPLGSCFVPGRSGLRATVVRSPGFGIAGTTEYFVY